MLEKAHKMAKVTETSHEQKGLSWLPIPLSPAMEVAGLETREAASLSACVVLSADACGYPFLL